MNGNNLKKQFKPFLHPVIGPVLTFGILSAAFYLNWLRMKYYPSELGVGPMMRIARWGCKKQYENERDMRAKRDEQQTVA